jgi:hypothetical protein
MTRGISVGTVVAPSVVKEAKESTKAAAASSIESPKMKVSSAAISFEDYTDKSFVVRGDTRDKKDELKELGGKWIKTRDGSYAWNFSKKKVQQVADLYGMAPDIADEI